MNLELVPVSRDEGRAFIAQHHRHSRPDVGEVFRVGLAVDGELVGVAFAGRPKAAALQLDGRTIEVTRLCTLGHEHACSRLYGAMCRAAKALGYQKVITYTLASESGSSLRGAGFEQEAVLEERDWSAQSGKPRYRENLLGERQQPLGAKIRWGRMLA